MHQQFGQINHTEPDLATIESSPAKEEWAIINKYKALEFERLKAKEKIIDREKKKQFRNALDQQLNTRNNAEQKEREQNRLYYHHLSEVADQQRMKEEAAQKDRFLTRKRMDDENVHNGGHSRIKDNDTGYHLEIGVQSEKEHKEKATYFRKQMMDTLDLQLKQKNEQQKLNKIKNLQMQEAQLKYQQNYFRPQNRKHFTQNQHIYDYYQQIDNNRQLKQKQMDSRFIHDAMKRKQIVEIQRQRQEEAKKIHTKQVVLETLGHQVKQLHRKRIEQQTTNPEDLTYGFISNIFQPKYKGYNKQQYKRELQQQAEQHRQRKIKENYMNQEQYKINMNQLSKAVIGNYAQSNYLDRSLGAIGNHQRFDLDNFSQKLEDKDAQFIKNRLHTIRNVSPPSRQNGPF